MHVVVAKNEVLMGIIEKICNSQRLESNLEDYFSPDRIPLVIDLIRRYLVSMINKTVNGMSLFNTSRVYGVLTPEFFTREIQALFDSIWKEEPKSEEYEVPDDYDDIYNEFETLVIWEGVLDPIKDEIRKIDEADKFDFFVEEEGE